MRTDGDSAQAAPRRHDDIARQRGIRADDAYQFFQAELPFSHKSHYSADNLLRSMNVVHPEPVSLDLGSSVGLTIYCSAGFYVRRRSGLKFFSDTAALGRAFMNGPGETYHLAFEGELRAVQLNLPHDVFDHYLLEDHDLSGGMSAVREPHGAIDVELLRLTARALLAEQDLRELAIRTVVARLVTAHGARTTSLRTRGLPPVRLRRVRDLVEAHPATVDLATMAREAGLSMFHFSREFRRETGQTPWAFVIFRRVWRAAELLRMGEAPQNVARHVGFADTSHMRRCFRNAIGATPAAALGRLLP